ncbi:hypothetical protein AB0A76_09045 [Streptomyces exfoliatus]|uniref:Uncharacterized protein n=1 Tax=Streptomyces exfoliatus TaxID=1905 RepID=A0ABV3CT01_STREX
MRIRMRVKISGTRDGVEWPDKGGFVDLPDAEAAQLLRDRVAEPLPALPVEETATATNDAEQAAPARRRTQAKK